MAYNSYMVIDDREVLIFDTVEKIFKDENGWTISKKDWMDFILNI
jgi:flavorubredoxin